jgi:signal peptidase I
MGAYATVERRNPLRTGRGERRNSDASNIAATLERRGRVSLRVQGSSMLPWVRPGDIANIRRVSADTIRCGDVVLFRRKSQLFVHRIIEKRGEAGAAQFRAKGDAHPTCDGLLEQQELLGRVVRIYRGGRRIDLDTPRQLALGMLISQLSLRSRFWYPLARLAAIVTRPARRLLQAMQPSGAPAH